VVSAMPWPSTVPQSLTCAALLVQHTVTAVLAADLVAALQGNTGRALAAQVSARGMADIVSCFSIVWSSSRLGRRLIHKNKSDVGGCDGSGVGPLLVQHTVTAVLAADLVAALQGNTGRALAAQDARGMADIIFCFSIVWSSSRLGRRLIRKNKSDVGRCKPRS
jgi:hypothetical protein